MLVMLVDGGKMQVNILVPGIDYQQRALNRSNLWSKIFKQSGKAYFTWHCLKIERRRASSMYLHVILVPSCDLVPTLYDLDSWLIREKA